MLLQGSLPCLAGWFWLRGAAGESQGVTLRRVALDPEEGGSVSPVDPPALDPDRIFLAAFLGCPEGGSGGQESRPSLLGPCWQRQSRGRFCAWGRRGGSKERLGRADANGSWHLRSRRKLMSGWNICWPCRPLPEIPAQHTLPTPCHLAATLWPTGQSPPEECREAPQGCLVGDFERDP